VKSSRHVKTVLALVVSVLATAWPAEAADPWHHPLYLGGGGYWRCRVSVTVRNETGHRMEGVARRVEIGGAAGHADLVGQRAEAVRVCDQGGVELLYGLYHPDATVLTSGPIPEGASSRTRGNSPLTARIAAGSARSTRRRTKPASATFGIT